MVLVFVPYLTLTQHHKNCFFVYTCIYMYIYIHIFMHIFIFGKKTLLKSRSTQSIFEDKFIEKLLDGLDWSTVGEYRVSLVSISTGSVSVASWKDCEKPMCRGFLLPRLFKQSQKVPLWRFIDILQIMSHRIHGTGIFPYIWLNFMVNVGKYTIHGSYGCCVDMSSVLFHWWTSLPTSTTCTIGLDIPYSC